MLLTERPHVELPNERFPGHHETRSRGTNVPDPLEPLPPIRTQWVTGWTNHSDSLELLPPIKTQYVTGWTNQNP